MLPALVLIALVLLVAALAWSGRGKPARLRSCCGGRPWPPDDLTGPAAPAPEP